MDSIVKLAVVLAIGYAIFGDSISPAVAGASRETCATVEVSAYNSVPDQTDSTPDIAAWGYRLSAKDKWKVAAVSPDVRKLFGKNAIVNLEGIGEVRIVDKTNARLRDTIDIYAHKSVTDAENFGRKYGVKACRR